MRSPKVLKLIEEAEDKLEAAAAASAAQAATDGMDELEKRLQSLRLKAQTSKEEKFKASEVEYDKQVENAKQVHAQEIQDYLETKEAELMSKLEQLAGKQLDRKIQLENQFTELSSEEAAILDKMKTLKAKLDVMISGDAPQDVPKVPECPACMEEMVPPTRIFQCAAGHPVCETCRYWESLSCGLLDDDLPLPGQRSVSARLVDASWWAATLHWNSSSAQYITAGSSRVKQVVNWMV